MSRGRTNGIRARSRARQVGLILLCLGVVLALAGAVLAVSSPALRRYVVAGGGGRAAGGEYVLHGTIGQPAAGTAYSGEYGLTSGFWAGPGAPPGGHAVYLPLVLRQ
jgi:hypothetical protein